jgi:hypothetical protein
LAWNLASVVSGPVAATSYIATRINPVLVDLFLHLMNDSMLVSLVKVEEDLHIFIFNAEESKDVSSPVQLVLDNILQEPLDVLNRLLGLRVKDFCDVHVFLPLCLLHLLWILNLVFSFTSNGWASGLKLSVPLLVL